MLEDLPVLVVVIPLISAFLIPLAGILKKGFCFLISMFSVSLVFIISLFLLSSVASSGTMRYHLGGWEPPWGIEYVVDPLSSIMLVVVTSLYFFITVYSRKSIEKEMPDSITYFYTLFMLLLAGLLSIVVTGDLFNLYVSLEIASLSAYTLVAIGGKKDALTAGFKYLVMGTISACFILLGIGFIYMVTGSLNMADVSRLLPSIYESKVVLASMLFFIVGLSIKTAIFPLHSWLPDAYTNAPSVVSATLAALMTKVGAYVIIRIMFGVFTTEFIFNFEPLTQILPWIAGIAILVGSINAIAQTDVKRMLAYSSISQIGYIILGIGLANQTGLTGSILHIINHALVKGCLFLCAGAIVYKTGIRNINDFSGLGKKMPYTMAAFSIVALSMVGIPPLCGFFSKWFLALGSIEAGKWILALVILLSSLLNAGYFFRILDKAWFSGPTNWNMDEAPKSMLFPTIVLSLVCVLLGLIVYLPLPFINSIADLLLQSGH